jgi:hypothetical protein
MNSASVRFAAPVKIRWLSAMGAIQSSAHVRLRASTCPDFGATRKEQAIGPAGVGRDERAGF